MELIINKKFWDKLSHSQQRLIELTCKAATVDMPELFGVYSGEIYQGK